MNTKDSSRSFHPSDNNSIPTEQIISLLESHNKLLEQHQRAINILLEDVNNIKKQIQYKGYGGGYGGGYASMPSSTPEITKTPVSVQSVLKNQRF